MSTIMVNVSRFFRTTQELHTTDMNKLIECIVSRIKTEKNKTKILMAKILFCLYKTGARFKEIAAVSPQDISCKAVTGIGAKAMYEVRLPECKGRSRVIEVSAQVWNYLKDISESTLGEEARKNYNKRFLYFKTRVYLTYLCSLSKLVNRVATHVFRRFKATSIYKNTKDIKIVQVVLGHKSPVMSLLYIRPDKESITKAFIT